MSEINTYVAENFNKYVMGIESMDSFDEFYQQLKDMGIETVLANYQTAYEPYTNNFLAITPIF